MLKPQVQEDSHDAADSARRVMAFARDMMRCSKEVGGWMGAQHGGAAWARAHGFAFVPLSLLP